MLDPAEVLRPALNCRYARRGIDPIRVGIGIDYGRALMIKAGHKGSTINDVVWMGDVVNSASNLCGMAGKNFTPTLVVSDVVYNNLDEANQNLLHQISYYPLRYGGEVINTAMNAWTQANCP